MNKKVGNSHLINNQLLGGDHHGHQQQDLGGHHQQATSQNNIGKDASNSNSNQNAQQYSFQQIYNTTNAQIKGNHSGKSNIL
jgi:hypothetical protein